MQKTNIFLGKFYFLRQKNVFFGHFYAFYGQRSVTAGWATRSPRSILKQILMCILLPAQNYNLYKSRRNVKNAIRFYLKGVKNIPIPFTSLHFLTVAGQERRDCCLHDARHVQQLRVSKLFITPVQVADYQYLAKL